MAFMNQERKAVIAAELKKVMPKDWKYTLRVQHHSTIIMTIQSAPVDLHGLCKYENKSRGYIQLNEFYLERAYDDPKVLEVLLAAKAALNTGNWDKSDVQTDYFNVGWYVSMHIGGFGKPFVVKGSEKMEPAPQAVPVVEPVVVPEVEPAEQSLTRAITHG